MVPSQPAHPVLTTPQLARLLEMRVLRADLAESEVLSLCGDAHRLGLAAIIVPPSDLDAAARALRDGPLVLGSVIDSLGTDTTAVKQYAARDALRRGARLIETELNRGKMHSRHFQYVEAELRQLVEACREKDGVLAVSLSPWERNGEELDILTARVARRTGVHALCTTDLNHARTLLELSRETYQVVLHGVDRPLAEVLEAQAAGCSRIGLGNAATVLREHAARFPEPAPRC